MPFFHNRYVKIAGLGLLGLIVLFLVLLMITSFFSSTLGISDNSVGYQNSIPAGMPGMNSGDAKDYNATAPSMRMEEAAYDSSYYYPTPQPTTDGYTSGLEDYETTQYAVSARTKQFDELCGAVTSLKADSQIHFKSINSATNYCRATFYVEKTKVDSVLSTLQGFKDVELTRTTQSVSRHKQQLESQTSILQQQLARVETSLKAAEAQLARLNETFYSSDNVTSLSSQVTNSLRYIDQLTKQKISLISQLNNYYQQAADLEERLGVVQFDVNINRSPVIYVNRDSQKWEAAWKTLSNTYTDTLIGLTAFFGVFLLWTLRFVLYLLVILVVLLLLWKFARLLWNKL